MPATGNTKPPTAVFIHGFLGFGEIPIPFFPFTYFRGLRPLMKRLGLPYLHPQLPRAAPIKDRAQKLMQVLDEVDAERFVLIGHSMGGLDARFAASHLDPRRRIMAVVTLGTPHGGSPLADWILGSRGVLPWIGRRLWRVALLDMTVAGASHFNETVPDREDVHYLSYAGVRPLAETPFWARALQRIIADSEGDNDAQVSVASAKWGNFMGEFRADHWELIGWNLTLPDRAQARPFPHVDFLRQTIVDVYRALDIDLPA